VWDSREGLGRGNVRECQVGADPCHIPTAIYGMYMGVGMALWRRFEKIDAELLLFIITGVASVSKTVMSVWGHAGR
jgi:hypothetical protein